MRQLVVPNVPQQNGVIERFDRTLIEMARPMAMSDNVDEILWAQDVKAGAYVRNKASTRALGGTTPYKEWCENKPIRNSLKNSRFNGNRIR